MTKRGALKKTMILMVGPPGAGKSTLVAERYPKARVLCPDDRDTPRAFRGFSKLVRDTLAAGKAKTIVVDRIGKAESPNTYVAQDIPDESPLFGDTKL